MNKIRRRSVRQPRHRSSGLEDCNKILIIMERAAGWRARGGNAAREGEFPEPADGGRLMFARYD